ncbi:periphilin-1 isoform X1 [Pleurodeles waltl]|uniref:periphilin-1 isoform X1 n=1 Tax=Pleurodeles waltl TaxID=8319 RepID=UPI003709C360
MELERELFEEGNDYAMHLVQVAFRRDEMWPEDRHEYEHIPRQRMPPRGMHPDDDCRRVVNIVRKKSPIDRCDEGNGRRYDDYGHSDYRDYDEGHRFGHERRSAPSYRGEDPGYRWHRDEHHVSRHPEYRESRESFRRKPFYPPPYMRERSPHKRDSPFFRESPGNRRESPHSRSGSSMSSRSYSPERSKSYSSHQHSRTKERSSVQALKSRDASPTSSTSLPPLKATNLEKGSRPSDDELIEAASKWASEKLEKVVEDNKLPENEDKYASSAAMLFEDQTQDRELNTRSGAELYEKNLLNRRTKAIAAKTKRIEEVYRQDCETFGMVVKMLIEKDPSLEKSVQFALKENLSEIGERCIDELKNFIAEYDAASQDFTEIF